MDIEANKTSKQDEFSDPMAETTKMSPNATDNSGIADHTEDKLKDNPYIANQPTGATLVLKQGEPFLPRPWKSIKHIIIVSYVCYLFLIFPGAIANQYAWEALKYKELGAWSEAKALAKSAVTWIYVGFCIGIIGVLAAIIVVCVEFA